MTGIFARSASTTELRPAIHSASPGLARRLGRFASARSIRSLALKTLWLGRSFAFGVGPRPSRPRLTRPPEPAVGLPLPVFLIAPLREELPAISYYFPKSSAGL